ncbi:MAG: ExbD/TolR family protein [Bacteriovoracaceae bacterium]
MSFQISRKKGPMADINVTPLVDVMLVLLVIFMITAPMMFNGIKLQLPKTKKVASLNLSSDQVILSINTAGEIYLGKQKVLSNEVLPQIKKLFKDYGTDVVYIRASADIKYGKVASLMSSLKRSGIVNIALVTDIEKDK